MPKRTKRKMLLCEKAKQYANQGYPVFPLVSRTKIPFKNSHGYKDASTSETKIYELWKKNPTANIGISTGKISDLVVIDVDVKNNKDGTKSYDELVAQFNIPKTRSVNTPSGGKHYYFFLPEGKDIGCRIDVKPGIDIRGTGGSIIAPPSATDDGKYEWVDESVEIAEMPLELLQFLLSHKREGMTANSAQSPLEGVFIGQRDDTLFRYACSLHAKGTSRNEAEILIIEAAKNCTPPFPENDAIKCLKSAWEYTPKFPLTEFGNVERLAYFYSTELKYVNGKGWLIWDINSHTWKFSDAGATRLAVKTVKLIEAEIKNCNDDSYRRHISGHYRKSQTDRMTRSILNIAKTDSVFELGVTEVDSDSYKLQVKGGVLDLESGNLITCSQDIFITKGTSITYDEHAKCPLFLKFLDDVFEGDNNLIEYIQKAIGYTLTGDNSEQCMFIMHGDGSNGKSVLQSIIFELLGEYAVSAPPQMLVKRANGSTNDLARLNNTRLLTLSEEASGNKLNEALVKQITGGDQIASRMLYGEFSDAEVTAKLWMCTNHLPKISGRDHAIWRRIKVLPFSHRVTTEHQDPFLRQKLFGELSGILNWAIEGCLKWQEYRLGTCEAVDNATDAYRNQSDFLYDWLNTLVVNNPTARTSASKLYVDYTGFTKVRGDIAVNQTCFGKALREHGYHKGRNSNGNYYHGISLKSALPRKRKGRREVCS